MDLDIEHQFYKWNEESLDEGKTHSVKINICLMSISKTEGGFFNE